MATASFVMLIGVEGTPSPCFRIFFEAKPIPTAPSVTRPASKAFFIKSSFEIDILLIYLFSHP